MGEGTRPRGFWVMYHHFVQLDLLKFYRGFFRLYLSRNSRGLVPLVLYL